ncbi:MAG: TolC family protein [Myxococcales bacterium]|nr:TolC family protein [Myxococcales bacterium]
MRVVAAGLLAALLGFPAAAEELAESKVEASSERKKLDADGCVEIALRESGILGEARGKVTEWEGRLAEVQSVFFPKLVGITYLAPLYRVTGDALSQDVVRDYASWGPYYHLKAVLAQPIYTFGRAAAGEKAASERLEVERARLAQARNVLALEVRRFYLLHLYAKSFKPALDSAKRTLDEAETKAKEMYAEGSGKVTNVDLMKLRYGSNELEKYRIQADIGAELALAALKHTMGLPQNAELDLLDETLPDPPSEKLPPLAELIQAAWKDRPEVAQLRHGAAAAMSFEEAERLSSMPVAFVAGQLEVSWTPMWPDLPNPFHWDRYNDITPGLAVGMQFDVDLAKSRAKAQAAHGMVEQVAGLHKFASTGIPMEVRKAHDDAVQAEKLLKLSEESSVAGRKWMIFAGSAYVAGTGEARDLLEGLAAYLQAKKGYYDNLQALHLARATIAYATGGTGLREEAAASPR